MKLDVLHEACLRVPRSLGPIETQRFVQENKDKTIIFDIGAGYAKHEYQVLHNGAGLSMEDIAYFCDGGNLCFGYRVSGNRIIIHTD